HVPGRRQAARAGGDEPRAAALLCRAHLARPGDADQRGSCDDGGDDDLRRRLLHALATTPTESSPIPSMATVRRFPGSSGPTPSGVPVRIKSPGSSVMIALMYETRYGT